MAGAEPATNESTPKGEPVSVKVESLSAPDTAIPSALGEVIEPPPATFALFAAN